MAEKRIALVETPFHCPLCDVKDKTLFELSTHIDDVHRGRIFICNTCNKSVKGAPGWNTHNKKNHDYDASATIYYAGTQLWLHGFHGFPWISYVKNELSGHHFCNCQITLKGIDLYHHIEQVHKGRIFVCGDCKEEFTSHLNLSVHNVHNHGGNAVFKQRISKIITN